MFAAAAAWSARSQAFSMLHIPHFKKFTASQLRIIVIEACGGVGGVVQFIK